MFKLLIAIVCIATEPGGTVQAPPVPLPERQLPFRHVIVDPDACGQRVAADVDGDGKNDMIANNVQTGTQQVVWYHWPDWRKSIITDIATYRDYREYRSDDLEIADVDGDGDADVIGHLGRPSDGGDGPVVWWENPRPQGDPIASNWTRHDIGHANYIKDLMVADYDGDGRVDVAARETTRTHVFVQADDGWRQVAQVDHPSHEGGAVGDLDGDGDLDVVLNGFWLENPSPKAIDTMWHRHIINQRWCTQSGHHWQNNNSNVAVGDVNGDGRLDVLLSHSELPGFPVAWYEAQDPRHGPWTEHLIEPRFDYCQTLDCADLDGDGDLDVLAANFPRYEPPHPVVVYFNHGQGEGWDKAVLSEDGIYHGKLGDLGSDGRIDILGSRNFDSPPLEVWLNEMQVGASFTHLTIDDQRDVRSFGLAFGDVTGDGRVDIVAGKWLYVNPGGDLSGHWERHLLRDGTDAVAVVDVDGDDRADVIALACNQQYWLEAADRKGTRWDAHLVAELPICDHHIGSQEYSVADLFQDGKPEIVVAGWALIIPDDPSHMRWPGLHLVGRGTGYPTGDMDGDGRLDLVGGCYVDGGTVVPGTRNVRWHNSCASWWRNPGELRGEWERHVVGPATEADRYAVADFSGDGRLDIAVAEERYPGGVKNAELAWFEAPAMIDGPWTRHLIATQGSTNNLSAADADGDGDVDLCTCEHQMPGAGPLRHDEHLSLWLNDGHGTFNERVVDIGKESHLGAQMVDLDGDGDLDIVSTAWREFQFLHLWRNDGNR